MPEPMVAEDLASGRLVRLAMPDWPGTLYPLTLLHRRAEPPGPAARRLMVLLAGDQAKAAA
jgi:DNA-binding transcriptional LysR family regulator